MMVGTLVLTAIGSGLIAAIVALGLAALMRRGRVRTPVHASAQPLAHQVHSTPQIPQLSTQQRERLEAQAATAFEAAVERATTQFGHDLDDTSKRLSALIVKLTTDIVEREFEEYKRSLAAARKSALDALAKMQTEIEKRQKSLSADIDGQMAARRQQLAERLDRRLGEAATAYIVESLGQGADIGSQRSWLLASLERHKADLKKDLSDEA